MYLKVPKVYQSIVKSFKAVRFETVVLVKSHSDVICVTELVLWNIILRWWECASLFKLRLFDFSSALCGGWGSCCLWPAACYTQASSSHATVVKVRFRDPEAPSSETRYIFSSLQTLPTCSSLPLNQPVSLILAHLHHHWHHISFFFPFSILICLLLTSATLIIINPPFRVCWRDQVHSFFMSKKKKPNKNDSQAEIRNMKQVGL